MRSLSTLLGAALLAACSTANDADVATLDTAAPAATATMPGGDTSDLDLVTQGTGVPAGFLGQVDPPREGEPASLTGASYMQNGDRWEVRTGPAHIVYSAESNASGTYTVAATIEQLEAPAHPEAFGLIIGGANLDQLTAQRYTYFIVRHTGEYMVRVRDGEATRTVVDWTASPAVPTSDASGAASYALVARVGADSVHFRVNDQAVAALPKADLPTDGMAGLRINHNLHLMVTSVTVTR